MTPSIKTLGELKKSGYISKSIKDELRDNLIQKIKNKESIFKGILGYEDTVIPEIERAILSRHNMNLLGLRGQAKTRIARQIVELLDEYTPYVAGSELNDDPLFKVVPASANKYLKRHSEKLFGKSMTCGGLSYNEISLYDFRHISSCYMGKILDKERDIMNRFGWKQANKVYYYSKFLDDDEAGNDDSL